MNKITDPAEIFIEACDTIYKLARDIITLEKFLLVKIKKTGKAYQEVGAALDDLQKCNTEIIAVSKKYIAAWDKMTEVTKKMYD